MLKKKRSLVTYTIIMCGLIMTVGIACLLFIQNSIVKDDMELQAYEKLFTGNTAGQMVFKL